jgi:hypothetical protein
VQDRDESRSRVFRIDVDRITTQGSKSDLGRAKSRPSLDGKAARFEQLGEHFRQ